MLGPVFVLGTTRSGTSSLQTGLLKCCGYSGKGEGHLTQLIYCLNEEIDRFYTLSKAVDIKGTMANAVSKDIFRGHFINLVRDVYAQTFDGQFCDKTPTIETIILAPLLQEIWPSARFIYCQRRGIENVVSKRKKFPDMSFGECCNEWRESFLHWYRIKDQLHNQLYIEQFDLATKPEDVVNRITDFLELNEEQSKNLLTFLLKNRLERSSASYKRISLDEVEWTANEKAIFKTICNDAMTLAGYELNA